MCVLEHYILSEKYWEEDPGQDWSPISSPKPISTLPICEWDYIVYDPWSSLSGNLYFVGTITSTGVTFVLQNPHASPVSPVVTAVSDCVQTKDKNAGNPSISRTSPFPISKTDFTVYYRYSTPPVWEQEAWTSWQRRNISSKPRKTQLQLSTISPLLTQT